MCRFFAREDSRCPSICVLCHRPIAFNLSVMSLDNPICIFCEENARAWDDDVLSVCIDEPGAPTAPARLHRIRNGGIPLALFFHKDCVDWFRQALGALEQNRRRDAALWLRIRNLRWRRHFGSHRHGVVGSFARRSWLLIRHRAARLVGGTEPAP